MSGERVMLLIDADNVSVDVMEQAVRLLLNQHGGLHVRRAYCTAETAVRHQSAFKRLGIRPMVNLAAGKNSTDIALAVDAVDQVIAQRPDVVVIASSDSDFAPLVQRLREKGCVVRGIGQHGKTGAETQDAYDDFTVLEHRRGAAAAAGAPPPRKTAARKAAAQAPAAAAAAPADPDDAGADGDPPATKAPRRTAAKTAAKSSTRSARKATPGAAPAAARPATRKAAAAKKAAGRAAPRDAAAARPAADVATSTDPATSADPSTPADPTTPAHAAQPSPGPAPAAQPSPAREPVPQPAPRPAPQAVASPRAAATSADAVLACLPELDRGHGLALNVAAQRLREAQLLGRNASSVRLFAQLGDRFELFPAARPTQVRLRAAA